MRGILHLKYAAIPALAAATRLRASQRVLRTRGVDGILQAALVIIAVPGALALGAEVVNLVRLAITTIQTRVDIA